MKLYIVPHSHIDVEWYWTAQDTEDMMPQLFYDTTLKVLEQDPDMRFAQDQSVIWDMMLQGASAEQKQLILDKVCQGAFEPVGGLYVQPEVQEPCGESFIRQLQIGQKWLEENLGRRARCAWHTDVFGQQNQLPQIFRLAGFDSFAFMRDVNDRDDPENFPTEFFMEAPDGSKILSHWFRISYVLCESTQEDHHFVVANIKQPETQEEELQYVFHQLLDETSLQHKTGIAMLPWGGDVYGLKLRSDEIREKLVAAARDVGLTLSAEDIIFAVPSEFFDALREKQELLPTKRCDFNPPRYRQDLRGTYMTRVGLKQKNRQAEQALLSYETLCACTKTQFDDGEELWKEVLFGQFHDTIGGSCIDEAYTAAVERDDAVIGTVTKRIEAMLGASEGELLTVWNPTQFAREELVTVQGKTLTVSVGPYECVSLPLAQAQPIQKTAAKKLENQFYTVTLDDTTGNLVSIWDKQAQRELLAGQGNVTVAMEEKDPDMEGGLRLTGNVFTDETVPADKITVFATAFGVTAVTEKSFLGFRLKKTIFLPKDKKTVEFTTEILDYPGTDLIITAQFSLNLQNPVSVYETPFAIETNRQGLYCAQKWAGLQEGSFLTAIINCGACAYFTEGSTLSLVLLRAHSDFKDYAKYGTDRGLARFADGRTHTELAAEKGDHTFIYDLVSGMDHAQVSAKALCCNAPLQAVITKEPAGFTAPVQAVEGNFIITAMMPANGGICIRGYHASEEPGSCTIRMAKPVTKVQMVDLRNQPMQTLETTGQSLTLKLRPFEIVTLQIS